MQKNNKSLLMVLVALFSFALGVWLTWSYTNSIDAQASTQDVHYVSVLDIWHIPGTCGVDVVDEPIIISTKPPIIHDDDDDDVIVVTPTPTKTNVPTNTPTNTPTPTQTSTPVPTEHPSNSNNNCGVGNGQDGDTPGCTNRNQDGAGTSPGNPGAQGGNGNSTKPQHTPSPNGKAVGNPHN